MYRPFLFIAFLLAFIHCNVSQQIQMPESSALTLPDEELVSQVQTLQRNVSELWSYIYQLRGAVSQHLNHLRQHQVELEDIVHRMSHHHDGHSDATHADHTDGHRHSGEQHSHSGEHSHGSDSHSHSGDSHSHGGDSHSHGADSHSHGADSHSHSGEHHSHGSDQHSHSGEHHSHGSDSHSHSSEDHSHDSHGHYHDSHSHSHSHSGDDHGAHSSHESGDSHHHHGHKDSHETEDDIQQTQQGADLQQVSQGTGPVLEPVVVAAQAISHNSHHTHGIHSSSSSSSSSSSGGSSSSSISGSSFKPLPLMHDYHHHHHHDNEPRRNRSRVVVLPKYSEYNLYEFAVCNVQPNRAIPPESQQEIVGQISLWQKKIGGPLNIHVRVQGFNMGDHHDHQQVAQQEEDNETPAIGHKHGFHIHTSGDLSNGCQSTGSHYNPKNVNHGGPNALVRHVGDLGNIECDDHGVANIVFSDGVASLKGQYSVVGRAMVIHSQADDYGLGGNDESLRTGNAGTRLACCVIEKVDKLPIRSYKAIKTASQYQN